MTRTRSWLLVLVATSTMSVSYVDCQALSALGPTITKALDLTETQFGWLGSAFAVAYLVGVPVSGALVDRLGARMVLPIAVLAWSMVAASHSLVSGLWTLAMLRILLGLAESPGFPSAAQVVTRVLPPDWREAGFGVLFTGSSLGAAIAAILLPWLDSVYGWRPAMVVSAVVGLAWLPLWFAATAGAAAQLGPSAEPPRTHVGHPIRHPAVRRAVVAVLASAPINVFVQQWGAKVLVGRHHLAQAEVGHYLWLPPVLFDLTAVGFGLWAAERTRTSGSDTPHYPLFAGAGMLLVVLALLGVGAGPWVTTGILAIALAGGGAIYTLSTADMLSRVPRHQVAAAGAMTAAAQSVAQIVAMPTVGWVLDRTHDYGLVGVGLAAWAVPGVAIWLLWDPRGRVGGRE